MRFRRGYKRTELGLKTSVTPHPGLMARVANASLTTGDMTPFRGPQVRQRSEGECTGAGFRRAVQLFFKCRNLPVPDLSDQALYTLGRLQDYAGINPDNVPPLSDTGADPVLVALAAQKVGVLFADEWPGPGDPGHVVADRNVEPHEELLVPAYDRRGLHVYEVRCPPGELQATCHSLLTAGFPVMAAFAAEGVATVDPEGSIVRELPPPSEADHWVTLLDSGGRPAAPWISFGRWDNWWDDPQNPNPDERVTWGDPSIDPRWDGTWCLDWHAAEAGLAFVLALDFMPNLGSLV